ncbi:glycoside hydrolase family 5 protein [Pseudoflavitalea sp. X16]|uniref:glycoside hydrolase family 5 protein n=1 Tax=Paraflavitalea devenefica TaxID=2716334 RepID=UPI0014244D5A|nr:glycoside hydrolase family 5 protein [Paraflavitalea devenefica]NII25290.1 glycoside hydrolase family 5 protein [Paraflavitalea devenefica]
MKKISGILVTALWLLQALSLPAQRTKPVTDQVYVDKNGIMRWQGNHVEVQGFGINYTVPFAHAYRAAKQLNISPEQAIDEDVYHFARLGLDAYRVHVWDTEISDTLGNLLENEHLKLMDYLLMKMKERRMKFLLTPIAYWGNGYPEPDEPTPGFARKYGKGTCLTHPDAIKAQENYLYQFMNHVNSYSGIAYKDDPDIIAFEISNEPHHGGPADSVTLFIKRMIAAIRKSGCKKPVFYNISHSIHFAGAYFKAGIEGGTFQWYPTGLGFRRELEGNLLPNVEKYSIPFAGDPAFKKIAKVVYEFDAADVGRSYIYPAMARSFREAGIQWATHFSYDPTYMAGANTEYNTHYMNLAYAPQKALSLKLASKVFHTIPMYKHFGTYPANTRFDAFKVSYEKDLAEMNAPAAFLYTNNTNTLPVAPDSLEEIAGAGSSPLVQYEGTGAYFLDRLAKGVWRLEVMPDAIWVDDPFGRNSLKKTVAVIHWRNWPMQVKLPGLGSDFTITGINDGNTTQGTASNHTFSVTPGTYLLTQQGIQHSFKSTDRWKNILLKEFVAPPSTIKKTYVLHQPVREVIAGKDHLIQVIIAAPAVPDTVELHVLSGFRPEVIPLQKQQGYTYTATIPGRLVRPGTLKYYMAVKKNGSWTTWPGGSSTYPRDWDFYDTYAYQLSVVTDTVPLYLFNAHTDAEWMSRQWMRSGMVLPTGAPGRSEMIVNVEQLVASDPDYSMRYCFNKNIVGRRGALHDKKQVVIRGRALNNKACIVQVALVTTNGIAWGGLVTLQPQTGDYTIPLAHLQPVKLVSLPRPYPGFLPYYFQSGQNSPFTITAIETLQLSIGPGIPDNERQQKQGVAIESIWLE